MFKKKLRASESGFTLMEILIVFMVIGIMAASAIGVYNAVFGSADTSAIMQNIQKLKVVAMQYASMNSGSFNGISAASMQQDGLLPAGWTTNANWAYPPNQTVVYGYLIGSGRLGLNDAFDIGFEGNNNDITDNEVKTICNDFANQIVGFFYNNNNYAVTTGGANCNNIPSDNNPINTNFTLGFE